MTTIPRSVVNARRTAGGILVLSALGTVIILIMLAARWLTQPPPVAGAMGKPSNTPSVAALIAGRALIIPLNSRRSGFMDQELGNTSEGGDEDKEAMGELNTDEALRELAQAVEALRADFRHRTQVYDHHQRMLTDRLHGENEQLRRAELERSQDPVIRDLISLADTCLRNGRAWLQREAVTPSDVDRVLREVADDVELILERQGVETFKPEEGTKFDRREARVVRSANTSDASRDGTVAEVLKPGYRIGDRILRYCEVVVWTFVAVPPADAAETEPGDSRITSA